MGNICGKTEPEPFSQPGRVLGSAPPPAPKTAPVPRKVGGPPRTLGGGEGGGSNAANDARRKAAEAAEARAKAGKPTGKLGTQLEAQRKQTRVDTLREASTQELQARAADEAAQARAHN